MRERKSIGEDFKNKNKLKKNSDFMPVARGALRLQPVPPVAGTLTLVVYSRTIEKCLMPGRPPEGCTTPHQPLRHMRTRPQEP